MIQLTQTDWGQFDLAWGDGTDVDAAVATLVYAVLFTDAEAPAAREPDRFDRRGWWADPQAGSGLWHVRRQPLHSAARGEAIDMVRTALQAHGPALQNVHVEEAANVDAAGNVSGLHLVITGTHNEWQFVINVPL